MKADIFLTNGQDLKRQFESYQLTNREADGIIKAGLREQMKPARQTVKISINSRNTGPRVSKKGVERRPLADAANTWSKKTRDGRFVAGLSFAKGYHLHLADQGTGGRVTKKGANRGAAQPKNFLRDAFSKVDPTQTIEYAVGKFITFISKKY